MDPEGVPLVATAVPPRVRRADSTATGAVAGLLSHQSAGGGGGGGGGAADVPAADEVVTAAGPGAVDAGGPGDVTLFWAGATLAMSTVGTGLLSLPSSFACLGLPFASGLLLLTALGMYFTGVLLLRCHLALGERATTYGELALHAFGPQAADTLVPAVIMTGLFGGCCAYVTLAKELVPALLHTVLEWASVSESTSSTAGEPEWWGSAELWTVSCLLPLPCCPRALCYAETRIELIGKSHPCPNEDHLCNLRAHASLSPRAPVPPVPSSRLMMVAVVNHNVRGGRGCCCCCARSRSA